MARYTGPKSKIARKFREPIYGPDKALEKKKKIWRDHKNENKEIVDKIYEWYWDECPPEER